MSSDIYNRVVNDRGALERLVSRLPGFEGYMDLKARRTADRLVRDFLATTLEQHVDRLAQIERRLLDQGGMTGLSRISAVKARLQTYHDRIKAAAPGYSGFFEAVKVDAQALDLIYGFDELQVVYADKLAAALDALDKAVSEKAPIDGALQALDALITEANDAFAKRDDVLTNVSKS